MRLTTFYQVEQLAESLSCLLAILCIIIVCDLTLNSSEFCTILHQRTGCPEIVLAKIAQCHDLVDAKLVMTRGLLTSCGLIPIDRQQVGSLAEVLSSLGCTFLIRETRQGQLTTGIQHLIDVWKTTQLLHHLEMPPCTEEIKLTSNQVFLLLGSSCQLVEISKT